MTSHSRHGAIIIQMIDSTVASCSHEPIILNPLVFRYLAMPGLVPRGTNIAAGFWTFRVMEYHLSRLDWFRLFGWLGSCNRLNLYNFVKMQFTGAQGFKSRHLPLMYFK